ncbi:MAG: O-antigen ligase family protein, partial [Microgenomates group bacterium]
PAFYYLEKEFKKEKIFIPFLIFLSYLFFVVFSLISFWFSVDKINTIDHLFFYLSAFFLLILGFNEKGKILKNLKKILILLGLSFSFLSILPKNWFEPTALQLIFPLYPNHNHLGDFLGIVMIWLFYDFIHKKEKKDLVFLLIFLPFFLLSFSRSAYIDFLIIASIIFFTRVKVGKKIRKFILGIFLIIFITFLFTQKEIASLPYLSRLLSPIYNFLNFQPRGFFSNRFEYFRQSLAGFLEKPFFGWGLGNFIYPSNKYTNENLQQVASALNLPLTILTETGIFGFFFFLLFFVFIIKNIDFNKKPAYFLFFCLILNFLTDYTYAIYGVFLFWFLLAGCLLKKGEQKNFFLYSWFSLVLMIFIFLKTNGLIFTLIGYPQIGFYFFPFNHQTFQAVVNHYKNIGEINRAKKLANQYYHFSSLSFSSLNYLSSFWEEFRDKRKTLFFSQRITDNNLFSS